MKNAILIPTYSEHFQFNINFLQTVNSFCKSKNIPHIFFITSTVEESTQLSNLIKSLSLKIHSKIFVLDIEKEFNKYNQYIRKIPKDMDSHLYFFNGRAGIVNLKKIEGLKKVFNKGYSNIIVLDSEVIVFRKVNLLESINYNIVQDLYRYSMIAYEDNLLAKIQLDSIRSIVPCVDNTSDFAKSYGWYENLCIYNKEKFYGFLEHLEKLNQKDIYMQDAIHSIFLKGDAFEWISYMAYRVFILKENLNTFNVDKNIDSNLIANAQNENLYQYFSGNKHRDALLLSKLNPPWVPYTENDKTRNLLLRTLPKTCCLMFHADRQHPGAQYIKPISFSKRIKLYLRSLISQ